MKATTLLLLAKINLPCFRFSAERLPRIAVWRNTRSKGLPRVFQTLALMDRQCQLAGRVGLW